MLVFERVAISLLCALCARAYLLCRDGVAAARVAQAAVDQIIAQRYEAIFWGGMSLTNPVKLVGVVFAESGALAALQSCDFDGTSVDPKSVVKWHDADLVDDGKR